MMVCFELQYWIRLLAILGLVSFALNGQIISLAVAAPGHPTDFRLPRPESLTSIVQRSVEMENPETIFSPDFQLSSNITAGLSAIPKIDGMGLGIAEFNLAIPGLFPDRNQTLPIKISPAFSADYLVAPDDFDLPTELYRATTSFIWMNEPSERIGLIGSLTPGVASDFNTTTGAFRLFGFAAATIQYSETVQLTLGASYLNRNDFPIVPLAGVTLTPNENWIIDLTIPRPRISRRLHGLATTLSDESDWIYMTAELGGGTWAVERPTGLGDELTSRDIRLLWGYEHIADYGPRGGFEFGFVFSRKLEYRSDNSSYRPDPSMIFRTTFSF